MKKRSILVISLVMALAIFLTACGGGSSAPAANDSASADKPRVLKLGHQAPAGTAYDILSNTFKDYVEERTNGRFQIDIYNGGQLGGDRELMEAVQV